MNAVKKEGQLKELPPPFPRHLKEEIPVKPPAMVERLDVIFKSEDREGIKKAYQKAFEKAHSDEGFWFKTEDGDVFLLVMRKKIVSPEAPEAEGVSAYSKVTANLFYKIPGENAVQRVGFYDRTNVIRRPDGTVKARSAANIVGTDTESELVRAMDELRDEVGTPVGFYVVPHFCQYLGGYWSGISRFLVEVQDCHSKLEGAHKCDLVSETEDVVRVYDYFYKECLGEDVKIKSGVVHEVTLPTDFPPPNIRRTPTLDIYMNDSG